MNEKIWDPLRKKYVALTPEESVRQWFINQLNQVMQVPIHMMMSEVSLNLGLKKFRADIIIYDKCLKPLVVVECKKPEVNLNNKVLEQTIAYNLVLDVRYIIITNGRKTFICEKSSSSEKSYEFLQAYPSYEQMLAAVNL